MKTFKIYSLLIAIISISLFSCDVIEEPFMVVQEVVSDSCEAFIFSPVETYTKKVLLEDYTGQTCGNCPRAAEKAHELQEQYGEQLVVIAVHAGWFSNTSDEYPNDFTTEVGDAWDTHFGNSSLGNPNGMIDRIDYPGSHVFQFSQWGEKIADQIQIEPSIGIQVAASYNASSKLICVDTQTEILNDLEGNLNITVVLIESGIISKQTDYSILPDQYVDDYEQNHVLRKGLTNAWGESLGQETYLQSELFTNRYSIEKQADWDINNMSVIAFVSNPETYEVVQVEELHLTE
jgi:thiol-disulfide isomerase/thioredoxin